MRRCPKCGAILKEEAYEIADRSSSSARDTGRLIPSGCTSGSVDYHVATKTKTIYKCPNPECGYLSVSY